ncbi:MAG: adenylate/guanylate cyclase domain-containing protein, partial [Actinomycetota bacterium]
MNKRSEPVVLPRGVVTVLLTDVADSTRWWTKGGPEPATAMARQAEIIVGAVSAHGGVRPVEQGEGDSLVAVFERASDALAAAVDAQLALAAEPWPGPAVAVRMAVHTGEAEFRDEQTYGGEAIIRCARLREHAQGGQVLVSAATAEIAGERLPAGTSLIPLGEVSLRGLARPERVHQLVHDAVTTTLADLGPRSARLGSWPTRLVGRTQERRDVVELIGDARLVTVTGTGGAGKTRLAHAVAVELSPCFDDVAWVDLAGLTADDEVATAVVRGCGAREVPGVGTLDVLTAWLRTRD